MHYLVHCGFEIFRNMTSNGIKLPFYVKNDFLKNKKPDFEILTMYYYNNRLLYKIISGFSSSFPVTSGIFVRLQSSPFASRNFDP